MPKLWRMSIIDPFEYTHDLGVVLSESGMAALMRELRRAAHVLSPTQPEGSAEGAEAVYKVELEGVKKRKTVGIELLCEAETAAALGKAMGALSKRVVEAKNASKLRKDAAKEGGDGAGQGDEEDQEEEEEALPSK